LKSLQESLTWIASQWGSGFDKALVDSFPIPVLVFQGDAPSRIIFTNRALSKATGYNEQNTPDLKALGRMAFPNPAYRAKTIENWRSTASESWHRNPIQNLIHIQTLSGKQFVSHYFQTKVGNRVFLFFVNLAAVHEIEQLKHALQYLPYPVALEKYVEGKIAQDPKLILLNHAYEEKFGYKGVFFRRLSDLLGRLYPDAHHRKILYKRWMEANLHTDQLGRVAPMEAKATTANGRALDVIIHTRILPEVGIRMVTITDITPQKELENALKREKVQNEKNQEVFRRRLRNSLAAASVAHEIDTSLGAILLQVKNAIHKADKHPNDRAYLLDSLQAILHQAESICHTIDRIRGLIGNIETRQEKVDLHNVIESALLGLRDRLKTHRITLRCVYSRGMPVLTGDETQIYLITSNLVRNSIRSLSSKQRGSRVIRIKAAPSRSGVLIRFEDSGNNSPLKHYRNNGDHDNHNKGMGLGLFLVRNAVANHKGRITFGKSSLGGWLVSVWLPVSPC